MISRIWHGWTTSDNADAYESVLKSEILPGIQHRRIPGYRGIDLLRRESDRETEFITILWFDTSDAIREFAGPDYEQAVILPKDRAFLSRYDSHVQHYDVKLALEL